MRKIVLAGIMALMAMMAMAQNRVGIGTTTPQSLLHLHGGNANEVRLMFSNNASLGPIVNSMAISYINFGNPNQSSYGVIYVPDGNGFRISQGPNNPFYINGSGLVGLSNANDPTISLAIGENGNGINRPAANTLTLHTSGTERMRISSTGNVGIGMAPYDFVALNVNGPGYFFARGNEGSFVSAIDTNRTPTLSGSGFGARKFLSAGSNFINLLMRGDKSQAYIQAKFKNGTADERTSTIVFDSLGKVGIGGIIFDSTLVGRFHVFGSQNIQDGMLHLHGHRNNYTYGSRILFSYHPYAVSNPGPNSGAHYYSIEHEADDDPTTDRRNTFSIVNNSIEFSGQQVSEDRHVGFALNKLGQVGIGRYPSKAMANEIKVDIAGKVRINGGLRLTGIGEASGKILVTNVAGDATWQNPSRITLDQSSPTGLSILEFRNGGIYRGSLGWDQAAGRFFFYDGESNSNTLFINNGRVGIQRDPTTNALEVNGNASKATAGDWLANSDARLKKDISPLTNALEKLLQLQGITYEWNDDKTGTKRPPGRHMGFTAQNVQQVFPQLVSTDAQGYLQTSYGTYDALYVEAIKALVKKVEALEAEITLLKRN